MYCVFLKVKCIFWHRPEECGTHASLKYVEARLQVLKDECGGRVERLEEG